MMKVSDMTSGKGAAWLRRIRWLVLVTALAVGYATSAQADAPPPAGVPTEDGMRAFALQWFVQMQAGKIDRTQYTAAYGAQLTDAAVQGRCRTTSTNTGRRRSAPKSCKSVR